MRKKLLPFKWYGGKSLHLGWLLPLLPAAETFVDVFCGSGCVLVNRRPSPLEVLNDLDHDLVTFFRVLRDDPEPLLEAIQLTPWSRAEHRIACTLEDDISDRERARRFLVRSIQGFVGVGHRCGGKPAGWTHTTNNYDNKKNPQVWQNYPRRLAAVARRLLDAEIECTPALDLIPRYDHPECLFYCDPPYVRSTRSNTGYAHEMSDDDHAALADVLNSIKGRAAVSGYRSPLYDEIYAGWHRSDEQPKAVPSAMRGDKSAIRQECLWTNFDPDEASGQPSLF